MEADSRLSFGDLLRRYRNSANLTQEELAGRTGLTPQAIGLLERGERRRPHKYTVEKLAEALGLTGQDLARFEAAAWRSSIHRVAAEPSHDALPTPAKSLVGRDHEVTGAAPPSARGGAPVDPDRSRRRRQDPTGRRGGRAIG